MSQLSRIGTVVQSDPMSQDIFPPRVRRWLFTTNHKEVGILYLVTSLFFFVAAGLLALTMRTQLSVYSNNRTQRWGCRTHSDHGLNNDELGEFSCDHVQDASSGHEVEEHASFPVGDSRDDLHDALRVSIFSSSRSLVVC